MNAHEPSNARTAEDLDEIRQRLRLATHDLRSMLGPIVGFAELITDADDIDQCRAHAARITRASGRLERLADELMDRILVGDEMEESHGGR